MSSNSSTTNPAKAKKQAKKLEGEHARTMTALESMDQRWEKLVSDIRRRIESSIKKTIETHYYIGQKFHDLHERKDYYGSRSAEELALAIGLSTSSVNKAGQFYVECQKDERFLEKALAAGVPWKRVTQLLPLQDTEKRLELMDRSTDLTNSQFTSEANSVKSGERKTSGKKSKGGKTSSKAIEGVRITADKLKSQLSDVDEVAHEMKQLEDVDPRKDQLMDSIAALREVLEHLQAEIQELFSRL